MWLRENESTKSIVCTYKEELKLQDPTEWKNIATMKLHDKVYVVHSQRKTGGSRCTGRTNASLDSTYSSDRCTTCHGTGWPWH